MTLKHPKAPAGPEHDLAVQTVFTLEGDNIPRHRLNDTELPPEVAYQIIHDELMLDGNARMNLATFVSTWMEPQAEKLMAECLDKNMIDKDEYPQTAELEMRCVNILSRLWHAPDAGEAVGCSTTGSSEAAMLGGLALKRRWQHRRKAEGKPADKPNLVMGINVQVCWEKFANYWDVEMRLVPMEGDRFHLSAEEAVKLCDENTIGVVAILGSTFDGSYEPVQEICAALDDLQERTGLDVPVHVDGASGALRGARSPTPISSGTSGCRGSPRSTPRATSTASSTRASAGSSGATPPRCPRTSSSGSTTSATTCRRSRSTSRARARRSWRSTTTSSASASTATARCSSTRARSRRASPAQIAELGPFELITKGDELPVFAFKLEGRDRQLHRLRRLERAARARLAGPGLHVPGEPHRPRGAAGRRQARVHARHGGPARAGPRAAAAAPADAARAGPRRIDAAGFHH